MQSCNTNLWQFRFRHNHSEIGRPDRLVLPDVETDDPNTFSRTKVCNMVKPRQQQWANLKRFRVQGSRIGLQHYGHRSAIKHCLGIADQRTRNSSVPKIIGPIWGASGPKTGTHNLEATPITCFRGRVRKIFNAYATQNLGVVTIQQIDRILRALRRAPGPRLRGRARTYRPTLLY